MLSHCRGGAYGCWLHMDKSIKRDSWKRPQGINIPKGYAYVATSREFELLELAESQKSFNIWSVEVPKVEPQTQDESIPDVWGNRVLVR